MKTALILALTGILSVGNLVSTSRANALTFSLNNSSGGTFDYDLTLAPNESLEIGDFLFLTGLNGVTGANATSPYSVFSFDSTSADFLVATDVPASTTNSQTFSNVISLTSNSLPGNINVNGTFNGNIDDFPPNISGPVTPVPFEPEANLAIFILLGLMGLNHYRKQLKL